MSEHFLGLEGANTIGTVHFLAAQEAIKDLVFRNAMGAIVGNAGLGKTFAVEMARRSIPDVESCRVVIPHRATMRKVAQTLLHGLTGETPLGERFRLADDLIRILSEKQRLVVVDEAQNANHDSIEFLRHIHDDPSTTFALALTGGHGCWEVLRQYPMLRNRIFRRVEFRPMDLKTVLQVIPNFHPIYADSDPQVIGRVDSEFAGGVFRDWAGFTIDADDACRSTGKKTVDDRVVDEVLRRRRGEHAA